MTSEELNAREEVKNWFTQQIEKARGPVKLPALVKRAVKHFMADGKFLRRFVQDFIYRAFYNLAVDELCQMRGPIDLRHIPVRLRPLKPSIWARWERHTEYVPGVGHVALLELTRAYGTLAIAERSKRREAEDKAISFLDQLIAPCRGQQKIRDRWKPIEVDALWETLHPKEQVA